VAAVLVTHDHPDHAPGASAFAKLVGAPLLAARLDGARPLRDGQVVRAGEVALTVIATPGHTADHLAFWEPSERALFTGDTVVGKGTSFIDSPGGDLAQYLRSLRRLQELGPRTIYPGHGPVVLDAPGKLDEYIAHRAEREQQILAALADGPATIETLVATIYDGYPVEVRPLAASSVLAHLRKLEAEGRAARKGAAEGADWQRIEPRTCERCGRRPAIGRSKLCGPCSLAVLQDTPE
jgi:glyoxylase-like metal-dependent hydrolase (beta-lactamase superfamily II)